MLLIAVVGIELAACAADHALFGGVAAARSMGYAINGRRIVAMG
jgi:hypothetical protein